jgi:four helix bundle protein
LGRRNSNCKGNHNLSTLLPNEEKYGLKSQICRAFISIPSNITEKSSRNSDLEFKRFLEMALGSAFELETQLILIQELNIIAEEKIRILLNSFTQLQKMINSFIQKLKN